MMEVYTSDSSDTDSRELKTLAFSRENLTYIRLDEEFAHYAQTNSKSLGDIETILLNHNRLIRIPINIKQFYNLRTLDLSSNNLGELPEAIFQLGLVTLIAKNNHLTNDSLPKTLLPSKTNTMSTLKELNLSGNMMTEFPEQCLDLHFLKYLYIGGNKIRSIPKDVWKMTSLQILSMGGNLLTEVPETVGNLHQLQALVLCDNLISSLPTSIARCKNLKSLLLHKNRLRHLPKDIVALQNLTELSLRENPLVVRFVQDICLSPPSLMELSGRIVKSAGIPYGPRELPRTVIEYLNCAKCCVNPNCQGVYFDNRVEHIKFVDFCGKYRVPLLQYLCSSKCIQEGPNAHNEPQPGASGYMMRKVLLG